MRVDSGVAGEGRVVGIPKFRSWGKCTMPLTNIDSDWMSNASSGLCIILFILYEQSNRTPRCSWKVSATGLPWLKHFTSALGKMLLSHKTWFCAANLLKVESLRVQSFVAS